MAEETELIKYIPEDSWLRRWMECWPNAEMPRSYILFSALSLLGAVYGRKVWTNKDDWRELYPMINTLFIGPSGIGKTSALELGFKYLVRPLPDAIAPQIIEGKVTPEKLHWDLRANPHSIIYAEELASVITRQKYMEGMIPYLTALLNYLPKLEARSKTDDVITVDKPEAVVLGGSTVKWLQEQLPDSATAGGFLPRFLILYEQHRSQRVALSSKAIGRKEALRLEQWREGAAGEFRGIVQEYTGKIDFRDYGVADVFTMWHSTHQPATGHLEPFAQRAGEYVLRLAMLVALSCHRNYMLEEDVKAGIQLYEYTERSLQRVVVPYSQKGQLLQLILDAVDGKAVSQIAIRKAMRNYISAQETDQLIESLIMSRDLRRLENHDLIRTGRSAN